ncbi:MAG: hypothetical protein HY738_07225 [Bacteroidia bacterium]|nr:hypothetical protein [Bacteroidia bacterium]
MITLQVNIENEIYANLFAELIANFTFVKSVEIPELTKTYSTLHVKTDELLVLPPKKSGKPSKYYGIWANKGITDVKQFRNNLWQRNK